MYWLYRDLGNCKNFPNTSSNFEQDITDFTTMKNWYDMFKSYEKGNIWEIINDNNIEYCGNRPVESANVYAVRKYIKHGIVVGQIGIWCNYETYTWDDTSYVNKVASTNDNKTFLNCAKGYKPYYGSNDNTYEDDDCVRFCESGYYNNSGDSCTICPKGYYCEGKIDEVDIKECETGYTTKGTGATSVSDCVKSCKDGEYRVDKYTCQECKSGYYCPDKEQRKQCENGEKSPEGATSEGQCYTECKPKEYLPKNEITCQICKKGYLCKGGKFYKKDYNQGIEFCSNEEYLNNDGSCHSCEELYTEGKYNNKDNLNGYISHNLDFKSNEIKTKFSSKEELNKDNEETNNNYCTPNYDYTKCSIDAKKSCYIKSKSTVTKQFIDSEETLEIIGDCSYDNLNINIDISIKNCKNKCKGQLDLTPECEDCINQCKSECKERYSNEYHNDCNKKCDDYDPSRLPGLA